MHMMTLGIDVAKNVFQVRRMRRRLMVTAQVEIW